LVRGNKTHLYCNPVLKRKINQQALRGVEVSGSRKIFLGTDSPPHSRQAKESTCGCAGCFSTHAAIELYAEVFEGLGVLDKLEALASINGPDFYGLPRNTDTITLRRTAWQVPASYQLGDSSVIPLKAGASVNWQVASDK
jgi:dihydroorotase